MSKKDTDAKGIRWSIHAAASEFGIDRKTLAGRVKDRSILAGLDHRFSTVQICAAIYGDYEKARLEKIQAETVEIKSKTQRREKAIRDEARAGILKTLKYFFDNIGRIVRDSGLGPERNQRVQAEMLNCWLAANGCETQLDVNKYAAANYLGRDSEADKLLEQTYEKASKEHQKIEAPKPN